MPSQISNYLSKQKTHLSSLLHRRLENLASFLQTFCSEMHFMGILCVFTVTSCKNFLLFTGDKGNIVLSMDYWAARSGNFITNIMIQLRTQEIQYSKKQ